MNDRAASLGYRSRSEYLCVLVEKDLAKAGLLVKVPADQKKLPRIGTGTKQDSNSD
jgi:hypothetical protein